VQGSTNRATTTTQCAPADAGERKNRCLDTAVVLSIRNPASWHRATCPAASPSVAGARQIERYLRLSNPTIAPAAPRPRGSALRRSNAWTPKIRPAHRPAAHRAGKAARRRSRRAGLMPGTLLRHPDAAGRRVRGSAAGAGTGDGEDVAGFRGRKREDGARLSQGS
jgi:hypothetical protein